MTAIECRYPECEPDCRRCPGGPPLSNRLSAAHEKIGAMRTALIAAQTVIDAAVHPRTAALIEIALNYQADPMDVIRDSLIPSGDGDPNEELGHGYGTAG